MRRIVLPGLVLLLAGCESYAGSPFVGFGGFIADTHSFQANPNRPVGDSPNVLRVEGRTAEVEPLTPEAGNVWPGQAPPEPTLQDIQHQQNQQDQSGRPEQPAPRRGSSTPPGAQPSITAPPPAQGPTIPPDLPANPPPSVRSYPAPGGAVPGTQTGNGVQTYTDPKGQIGIIVPNANGTSTMIAPDGTVTTVPNPR
ncbi:conserved exported protein of unknown function [Rhodovastum atsumiense]|uniref:Lipoprotein n=1 Tax=Rhodovastum atsumiense TaxID=504468 RepID=A0A5M6J043_9PROT|nr:hypothetical protein [Rhodovastum atsumiense]KAA5612995.1 hypothetical protein F1189_06415 [Rhodovastum atsumiense]CAH2600156.1 conserved exported protein of unknown function [Rhodovastum atsumiense]